MGSFVVLPSEGVHTITYWSLDGAGNVEAVHTIEVKVKLIDYNHDGQYQIDDVVQLLSSGTLQQRDVNHDGIFDRMDVLIMLGAILPIAH